MNQQYVQIETERLQKELRDVNRQIARTEKRVAYIKNHQKSRRAINVVINEHGGWELGYWEGRLYILEERQDFLKELLSEIKGEGNKS